MKRDYNWVVETIREKLDPEDDLDRRMQIVVDALWEQLHDKGVSWVGFYLEVPDAEEMVLGPMHDKPACSPIGLHGVCGQAFAQGQPIIIRDVKDLGDAYIACDPRDQSEVVIPVFSQTGRIMGVLDLDSHDLSAFEESDTAGLIEVLQGADLYPDKA